MSQLGNTSSGNIYIPPVLNPPVTPNQPVGINAPYVGSVYAYNASGGFVMEQGLKNILISPIEKINKYDVTEAFQVKYDVRLFNDKLGVKKTRITQWLPIHHIIQRWGHSQLT